MKLDDQMHEYMRERGPVNYYLRRRYGCVWRNRPSSWLLSWPRRLHRPVYVYECARCGLTSGPVRAWLHQMRCR